LRSLRRFICVHHTHYLAIARLVAARRAGPSRFPPRTLARASVLCQGRSLFRPLGSPGGTGGPLSKATMRTTSESDLVSQQRYANERREPLCLRFRPLDWWVRHYPVSLVSG